VSPRIVLITDEVSADVSEAVRFARAHGIEKSPFAPWETRPSSRSTTLQSMPRR
jgi:hypothetical protein